MHTSVAHVHAHLLSQWLMRQVRPPMNCIICLSTSTNARPVCSCSSRVCRRCFLGLLDRGRQRCVVCGSRYQPSSVVRACLFGVQNADVADDPAKSYAKLAVAYSNAGRPRRALRSLAIAQNLAVPGTRWYHFIVLETAQNLLVIGDAASAERCLQSVMPSLLSLPTTLSSGVLYSSCCVLLSKTSMQLEKRGTARAWLRRAMHVQGDLGLDLPLADSLQLDAKMLSREGQHRQAKESLQRAERILLQRETDEGVKCQLQVDLAAMELQLGENDQARGRLFAVLPTLRRRKRDRFSAELLPVAARALSRIVSPTRRLRRKTRPEMVQCRERASTPAA